MPWPEDIFVSHSAALSTMSSAKTDILRLYNKLSHIQSDMELNIDFVALPPIEWYMFECVYICINEVL